MRELKQPKNLRRIKPRCCETCNSFTFLDNGIAECVRPHGPAFDVGDREFLYWVCDLWQPLVTKGAGDGA